MFFKLSIREERLLLQVLHSVCAQSRFLQTACFMQHGSTTVLQHCLAVAAVSCWLARRLGLRVDRRALIRGALLHDYFLYDWHQQDGTHRWHGFTHPRRSLDNALSEFALLPCEQDSILRHMFPLTPVPPRSREGWLICLADKYCSARETLGLTRPGYGRLPRSLAGDGWQEQRRGA